MAGSGWQIDNQMANQVRNTPTGSTVEGVWIYWTTGKGNSGASFVPDNIYRNKKRVHAILKADTAHMDEIGDLSEPLTD